MRITHFGGFKLGTTNGNYNALWELAKAQAAEGHEVSIVRLGKLPSPDDVLTARDAGVSLIGLDEAGWLMLVGRGKAKAAGLLAELHPDIAHFQYVRIPHFLPLAKALRKAEVPIIISPHGGLNSVESQRHSFRKRVYWSLIERRVHAFAAGLHFVSTGEMVDYCRATKSRPPRSCVVPNIVTLADDSVHWRGPTPGGTLRLAYLGRYDVWHKGLDLLLEMSRNLRRYSVESEVHLYGTTGKRYARSFKALRQQFSDVTVIDHGIVHGREKSEALASCDAYVQYSRFEVFGISMAEALAAGTPVFLSAGCDLAEDLAASGAAFVIPMQPLDAARIVSTVVRDPNELIQVSKRGARWARENLGAHVVAQRMIRFYATASDAP